MQNKPYPAPYLDDLNHLYKGYFIKENDLDELNAEIMAGKVTDFFRFTSSIAVLYFREIRII